MAQQAFLDSGHEFAGRQDVSGMVRTKAAKALPPLRLISRQF
jgi:hypothetical protein